MSSSSSLWSQSTVDVMDHLKRIRPNDGWSVEIKEDRTSPSSPIRLVRLLRRNVPLTNNYFLDLYYDRDNTRYVVGILNNLDHKTNTTQGCVILEGDGQPINIKNMKVVTISSWKPLPNQGNGGMMMFTEEQKTNMMYQFLFLIGSLVLARIFLVAFIGLYILALPILIFIMMQQCPIQSSFDPKKELKRVLRGYYLPDNDPNKPKGFIAETLARINSTVTTELATLPGYEVTTINLLGAAIIQCVRVPSVKYDFYWIGAFNNWYYITSTNIPEDSKSS